MSEFNRFNDQFRETTGERYDRLRRARYPVLCSNEHRADPGQNVSHPPPERRIVLTGRWAMPVLAAWAASCLIGIITMPVVSGNATVANLDRIINTEESGESLNIIPVPVTYSPNDAKLNCCIIDASMMGESECGSCGYVKFQLLTRSGCLDWSERHGRRCDLLNMVASWSSLNYIRAHCENNCVTFPSVHYANFGSWMLPHSDNGCVDELHRHSWSMTGEKLTSGHSYLSPRGFGHHQGDALGSYEKISLHTSNQNQQASENHKPIGVSGDRVLSGDIFEWLTNDPAGGFVVGLMMGAAALGVGALIGAMPSNAKPKRKNKSGQDR